MAAVTSALIAERRFCFSEDGCTDDNVLFFDGIGNNTDDDDDSDLASAQDEVEVTSTRENWRVAYIITFCSFGFLLLLTSVLIPVCICSYRSVCSSTVVTGLSLQQQ